MSESTSVVSRPKVGESIIGSLDLTKTKVVALISSVALLGGCANAEASPDPEAATVTVTATPESESTSTPEPGTQPETTTEAEPATKPDQDLAEKVDDRYESVTIDESLMPAINYFRDMSYDENHPDRQHLEEIYPGLANKIWEHGIAFEQRVDIDSIKRTQADLQEVFDAEYLMIDDNGDLVEDTVSIAEFIDASYQENFLLFDINSVTHIDAASFDHPERILSEQIYHSSPRSTHLTDYIQGYNAVEEYFYNQTEEYIADRKKHNLPVSNPIAAEFVEPHFISDPGSKANLENITWLIKNALEPNFASTASRTFYPVNFIEHTIEGQSGQVTTYGLSILSGSDYGTGTDTRLDTFVFVPHDEGYFKRNEAGDLVHVNEPSAIITRVQATDRSGLAGQ